MSYNYSYIDSVYDAIRYREKKYTRLANTKHKIHFSARTEAKNKAAAFKEMREWLIYPSKSKV